MVHVIEFQKRGLPHAHILVSLKPGSNPQIETFDKFVQAEIPDPITQPSLYNKVVAHNIHGPCGDLNPQSVCMQDGSCQKKYPKSYHKYC